MWEHLRFGYCNIFNLHYMYIKSQLQWLRPCPRRRVTEKSHLFHTNHRYVRGSTPEQPAAATDCAIHYDFNRRCVVELRIVLECKSMLILFFPLVTSIGTPAHMQWSRRRRCTSVNTKVLKGFYLGTLSSALVIHAGQSDALFFLLHRLRLFEV